MFSCRAADTVLVINNNNNSNIYLIFSCLLGTEQFILSRLHYNITMADTIFGVSYNGGGTLCNFSICIGVRSY